MSVGVLYSKQGLALGEVVATFNRQWVSNQFGECKFELAAGADAVLLEKGNFLVLEHDSLPPWVGTLDTPQTWGAGKVLYTAYSAERLFQLRPGLPGILLKGSAGVIYRQIIEIANSYADTLIRPGNIWTGGTSREETVTLAPLYDDIIRISQRSRDDWWIEPQVIKGQLSLLAHWDEERGEALDFVLEEGVNIELKDNLMDEQGEIWNGVIGYGNGATWDSKPKTGLITAQESWDDYGPRIRGVFVDTDSLATVEAGARAYLRQHKQPRRSFNPTATDVAGTFEHLDIGNVLDLKTTRTGHEHGQQGLETSVEILEMTYREAVEAVDLVVDEEKR